MATGDPTSPTPPDDSMSLGADDTQETLDSAFDQLRSDFESGEFDLDALTDELLGEDGDQIEPGGAGSSPVASPPGSPSDTDDTDDTDELTEPTEPEPNEQPLDYAAVWEQQFGRPPTPQEYQQAITLAAQLQSLDPETTERVAQALQPQQPPPVQPVPPVQPAQPVPQPEPYQPQQPHPQPQQPPLQPAATQPEPLPQPPTIPVEYLEPEQQAAYQQFVNQYQQVTQTFEQQQQQLAALQAERDRLATQEAERFRVEAAQTAQQVRTEFTEEVSEHLSPQEIEQVVQVAGQQQFQPIYQAAGGDMRIATRNLLDNALTQLGYRQRIEAARLQKMVDKALEQRQQEEAAGSVSGAAASVPKAPTAPSSYDDAASMMHQEVEQLLNQSGFTQ